MGGQYEGLGRRISTSTNGLNRQTRYYQPGLPRLLGITYGKHRFGADGAILVSDSTLQLGNFGFLQNGFRVNLNGDADGIYRLQTTTDLVLPDWRDVIVVTNNTGKFTGLVDTSWFQSPQKFYRVIAK